jgi:hypothetical protein
MLNDFNLGAAEREAISLIATLQHQLGEIAHTARNAADLQSAMDTAAAPAYGQTKSSYAGPDSRVAQLQQAQLEHRQALLRAEQIANALRDKSIEIQQFLRNQQSNLAMVRQQASQIGNPNAAARLRDAEPTMHRDIVSCQGILGRIHDALQDLSHSGGPGDGLESKLDAAAVITEKGGRSQYIPGNIVDEQTHLLDCVRYNLPFVPYAKVPVPSLGSARDRQESGLIQKAKLGGGYSAAQRPGDIRVALPAYAMQLLTANYRPSDPRGRYYTRYDRPGMAGYARGLGSSCI